MARPYGVLLSNKVEDLQRWLPVLARYPQAELQCELATLTSRNVGGVAFCPAPDEALTPGEYLRRAGVEVSAYVDVTWPPSLAEMGTSSAAADSNVYWLRRGQWAHGQALQGRHLGTGEVGMVLGIYGRPTVDLLPAYRAWLAETLLSTLPGCGVRTVRVDDGMVHRHGCYRPWQVAKATTVQRSDEMILSEAVELYRVLRANGLRVVVNGGWEMADPGAVRWTYPLLDTVDGVMIEYPGGFARWSDGRYFALTPAILRRVALDWRAAGRQVIIVVASASVQAARDWWTMAQEIDVDLAVMEAGGVAWFDFWGAMVPPVAPPATARELYDVVRVALERLGAAIP